MESDFGISSSQGRTGQQQTTRVDYPLDFLRQQEQFFGRGFTPEDILRSVPQSPGLFGGGTTQAPQYPQQVAQGPPLQSFIDRAPTGAGAFPPRAGSDRDVTPTQRFQDTTPQIQPNQVPRMPQGQQVPFPEAQQQAQAPAGGGGSTVSIAELTPLIRNQFGGLEIPAQVFTGINDRLRARGYNPDGPIPTNELIAVLRDVNINNNTTNRFTQDILPGFIQNYADFKTSREQPLDASRGPAAPAQVGIDVQGGLNRLGFGQAPPEFQTQNIRDPRAIQGPTVQTQDVNVPRGSLDAFEKASFESRYRPVQRELTRSGAEQDRQLRAQLAQTGLSSSGTGMGLLGEQRNERQRVLAGAAQDAANNATTQRFGVEVSNAQINAERENANRLANAGFDYQAQAQNADNILRGDTARADNYLKTMGLNVETAAGLREDFLKELGLQQADLERLDASQRERVSLALNAWLQSFAAMRGAGVVSYGEGFGRQDAAGATVVGG